jgi:type IV pilus assembly protein PilC
MAIFRYKAINGSGRTVVDSIEAQTADQAVERLSAKGMTPLKLTALKMKPSGHGGGGKVSDEELILFTTQLATMMRAGVPILRSVEILESEAENSRLKSVCAAMAADIRGGSPLNVAVRRHPKVFPPLYRNMVAAGEASGNLPQVLQRLIYVISHEHKVRSEIRSVMQYPIMVLVVLVSSMGVLLTTVVPRFAAVYLKAKIELPLPTRICIAMSNFLRDEWIVLMIALVFAIAGVILLRRTDTGRYWMDRFVLQIPYVGSVMTKSALSRFASIFSILQASGVGMIEAIDILAGTLSNRAMVREFKGVQAKVEHGHGLSRPLASARYFTPMFVSMVAIGEETGKLDEMLREISTHYDAEVEFATKRLTGAIGPLLIVTLAVVVGFFALAVYMPMWDIAKLATRAK